MSATARRRARGLLLGGALAGAVVLGGCGYEPAPAPGSDGDVAATHEPGLDQQQLVSEVGELVEAYLGTAPEETRCRGGLPASATATQECAVFYDGRWHAVSASVGDIDGAAIRVNVQEGEVIPEPDW